MITNLPLFSMVRLSSRAVTQDFEIERNRSISYEKKHNGQDFS